MKIIILFLFSLLTPCWADRLPSRNADAVNTEIPRVFNMLESSEKAYVVTYRNRRHIQILSVGTNNADTGRRVDNAASKPGDRADTWADLDPDLLTQSFLAIYAIDEYRGSVGSGFILHAEVIVNGVVWRRSRAVGPESRSFVDADDGWYQATGGQ